MAERRALPVLMTVMDRVMESGSFPSKMRLNLKAGSALLIDPRLIHRGTPNTSDHTRLEPSIGYTLSWSVRAPSSPLPGCGLAMILGCVWLGRAGVITAGRWS